jgi:hypothetical protein
MPQSPRLRVEYRRLAETLLAQERADLLVNLGPAPDALERHLRRIDEARRLSQQLEGAHDLPLGEEPQLIEGLDQYARADHLLQPVMDTLARVIDVAIARAGVTSDVETYACVLPTGTINAQARSTANGVLVLVNTGLVMVLFQATQALAHAALFPSAAGVGGAVVADPRFGRALYTDEQIGRAFASVLLAYILCGDSTKAIQLPPLGGVRGQVGDALWQSAQIFTVAHEFGHVLAGHTMAGRTKYLATPGWAGVEVVAKSWDDEFEADRIAVRLVAGYADGAGDPRAPAVMICGPAIFFAVADAVDRVRTEALGLPVSPDADHPPSAARASRIRDHFSSRFGAENFELADHAVGWLERATEHALHLIARARV